MADSDLAFLKAKQVSEDREIAEVQRGRQETRQKTADERTTALFNRSTTLFEQQQEFIADERRLIKFGRDGNAAIALFRATRGQVFQPVLDLYDEIPDGGKFHQFRRNEDGTFDYDVEWGGQRFKKAGAKFDEVGKMAMSIANPVMYLEESGAIAAAEAEFLQKRELAMIKALGRRKREVTRLFGDKLSTKEWVDMRAGFFKEYTDFRFNQPELLEIPDAAEESGVRQLTFDEYQSMKFGQVGIDVSGARIDDTGNIDVSAAPPNPLTSSFGEMQRFLEQDEDQGGESTDAAIQVFIDHNRADELADLFLKDPGTANTLTPEQESRILRAKSGAAADSSPAAKAEDAKQAAITVEQISGVEEKPIDPFAAFAEKHPKQKQVTFAQIGRDLRKIGGVISEFDRKTKNQRLEKLWTAFIAGNERDINAKKMLAAGQTPEGRAEIAKEYRKIRGRLPVELQEKLDKVFPQSITAGAIPEPKENRT